MNSGYPFEIRLIGSASLNSSGRLKKRVFHLEIGWMDGNWVDGDLPKEGNVRKSFSSSPWKAASVGLNVKFLSHKIEEG